MDAFSRQRSYKIYNGTTHLINFSDWFAEINHALAGSCDYPPTPSRCLLPVDGLRRCEILRRRLRILHTGLDDKGRLNSRQAHGGRLWAENGPEGGATFSVALPLLAGQSKLSSSQSGRPGSNSRGIVDVPIR